jgi:TetR/AcrR family transcriptional regulator, tetracycline repressor protein
MGGRGRARLGAPESVEERRTLIVHAALDLLDAGGFDQMSLRRLAAHLHMHAPGLYWYIESKQDLVDRMAKDILDRGLADLKRPAPDARWEDWLVDLASAIRAALLARRDGARVAASAFLLATGGLTSAIEIALEILGDAGFEPLLALGATMTIVRYAIGAALGEQTSPMTGIVDAGELERATRHLVASVDPARWPRTAAAYRQLFENNARDRMGIRHRDRVFRWGAEMLVRGIAAYPRFTTP